RAEAGIRASHVTGVQTCALPICAGGIRCSQPSEREGRPRANSSRAGLGRVLKFSTRFFQPIRGEVGFASVGASGFGWEVLIVVRSEERRVGNEGIAVGKQQQ